MFSAFRFGIPAVYGEVGGPPIRLPRNPAPVAANNPPTAGEADNNPPIQIPPPNHHDIDHNDGGNVRKYPSSPLVSFHSTLTTTSNTVFFIYTSTLYSYESEMDDCFYCIFLVPLSLCDYGCLWLPPTTTCTQLWQSLRWP